MAVDRHFALEVGDKGDRIGGESRRCGKKKSCEDRALYVLHGPLRIYATAGAMRAVRMPQTVTGLWPFTLWLPSGSKLKRTPIRLTTASVMMILRPRSLVSPSPRAATVTASL